jgi:hypothetical protein
LAQCRQQAKIIQDSCGDVAGQEYTPIKIPCALIIKMEFGFREAILYLDVGDVDVPHCLSGVLLISESI